MQCLPHDLLLQRALRDEAVDIDDLLLTDAMRTVHGLGVVRRIPIVVIENNRIGSREVDAETACTST